MNVMISLALLLVSASLMHLGDTGRKNQALYFAGGIVGCIFLSHLLFCTLSAFIKLL